MTMSLQPLFLSGDPDLSEGDTRPVRSIHNYPFKKPEWEVPMFLGQR